MAKITRKPQSIFGSGAGSAQLAQIGSLAAGSPQFTSDPAVMQALSNYTDGLFDVVIGENSPAIEDLNSLFYLATYQLAYLMQQGIAEYDGSTTYFQNSVFQSGGSFYQTTYGSASGVSGVTPPNTTYYKQVFEGSPTYVLSSSSGTFTTSGSGSVTNMTATITANNSNPISVEFTPDGSLGSTAQLSINADSSGGGNVQLLLYKNGSSFEQTALTILAGSVVGINAALAVPPSSLKFYDFSPGGSANTYSLHVNVVDGTFECSNMKMLAKQVNS
jgi:hypothetical protein